MIRISFAVARRAREIGVAWRWARSHGAGVSLVGIVIGVAAGLLSVALLATAIPALRAAIVDPNRTLRTEECDGM